jgi:hypothetical protein
MSQTSRIQFRLGSNFLTLEVPPFYVNFDKMNFSSIMVRKQLPKEGIVIYVYVTRHRHVEKLLLLRRLHPDIFLSQELQESGATIEDLSPKELEEFQRVTKTEGFERDISELEKEWEYSGNGVWIKSIGSFVLYMILVMKESRWTIRPAISKEGVRGYGFELPVDTSLSNSFAEKLEEGELEEIHNHVESQHFHLTVNNLERCKVLASDWDYYFSTRTRWKQTVFLSTD